MIKVNGEEVQFKKFNDGTLRLRYGSRSLVDMCVILWLYNSDEEMADLFFLVNHLREKYEFSYLILEMPYCPHARMDRCKEYEECFTLKYFCDFINSLHFNQVRIYDPHSNVATALLNNVQVEKPEHEIQYLLHTYPNATLFFTDEGAQKRYKDIIGDTYFSFGVKEREWSTQKINSLQVLGAKHMIAGHDIIIVDDIISRGSTLYLAAKQLKEMGCDKIYVWASHCENTVLQPHINGQSLLDIPNLIEHIYTSNTIYTGNHPKIDIIREFQ
jgi:ribose-phosphate pyrophosphokinase